MCTENDRLLHRTQRRRGAARSLAARERRRDRPLGVLVLVEQAHLAVRRGHEQELPRRRERDLPRDAVGGHRDVHHIPLALLERDELHPPGLANV